MRLQFCHLCRHRRPGRADADSLDPVRRGSYHHRLFLALAHFSLAVRTVVGSALITDIFSEESLSISLALLNATPWVGIVIGLRAGGIAIRLFQITSALMLAILLSLAALLLLIPVSEHKPSTLW
jgi:predicted MFS family arabinose efflux permease